MLIMQRGRCLQADESGVSDVVGTVLMITITVLMATIVAIAIFNLQPPMDIPHIDVDIEPNGSNVDVVHMGGEPVDVEELKFMVHGQEITINNSSPLNSSNEWSIGTTITLDTNNTDINLIHKPSQGLIE
ncbi:type IV pilin [Methanohalophilus portucalensis FDF-1]|uniref:Type IV pilin n=3 Tax=Methanohalophilus portucalensis TaxID=39664 RepID=A0A3M9L453_9EURY|nr:hypothetical protein BKM01_00715 [Methanohalophilus portucalensis]RNI08084.1 type IV pilin [Methanohalophilus portucalensis FDF-1]